MVEKEFVLRNLGMNRDLSVSKAGESSAFENRNIRITARDHDTLLSVTNERGTKELNLGSAIEGKLIGWNVLNNHIILFTHKEPVQNSLSLFAATGSADALDFDVLAMWNANNNGLLIRIIVWNAGDDTFVFNSTNRLVLEVHEADNPSAVVGSPSYFTPTISAHSVWYQDVSRTMVRDTTELAISMWRDNYAEKVVDNVLITDYDEGTWNQLPTPPPDPGGGGDEPDPGEDPLGFTIEAVWDATNNSADYTLTIENGGTSSVQLTDVVVKFITTNSSQADPENGLEVAHHAIGIVSVDAGETKTYTGTVTLSRVSGRTYWVHPEATGRMNLDYQILTEHEDSGGDEDPVTKSVWLTPTSINFDLASLSSIQVYLHELKTDNTNTVVSGEWTVEGANIVTLTEGQTFVSVTPVAVGTCRVVGSYNGFSAACTVTVVDTRETPGGGSNPHGGSDEPELPKDENASTEPASSGAMDFIYRIDYVDDQFVMVRGRYGKDKVANKDYQLGVPLYNGNLNFDCEHPIESIVYYETEDVQKIYWVDGKNVLRFLNFNASLDEINNPVSGWKDTSFDSNRFANFRVTVRINKDNSGNVRPNGVTQYMLTYFNRYGQESGFVWVSDLVYLSPTDHGGAADGTNSNCVYLTIRNLDCRFSHFRIYSIFRSSYNGEVTSYLVSDMRTTEDMITVVDDGSHLVLQDATRLLYLGSLPVVAGTMAHKDQTLFLGDLQSVGKNYYPELEAIIRRTMFDDGEDNVASFVENTTWKSHCIEFVYTNDENKGTAENADTRDIPYVQNVGNYAYQNQLIYSSSRITTFKGGEKYRFALKFTYHDGTSTEAFWIGDLENPLYPVVDKNHVVLKRVVAKCTLPSELLTFVRDTHGNEFATVQLLVAEATYADRSVKAQGIINPTMFNVWERYNERTYSLPSWISRPRGSRFANRHFDVVAKSTTTNGEIQCNYWESDGAMVPYFQYKNYNSNQISYNDEFEGMPDYTHLMLVFSISYFTNSYITKQYSVQVRVIFGRPTISDPAALTDMLNHKFADGDFKDMIYKSSVSDDRSASGYYYGDPLDGNDGTRYELLARFAACSGGASTNDATAIESALANVKNTLINSYSVPEEFLNIDSAFTHWCQVARNAKMGQTRHFIVGQTAGFLNVLDTLNYYDGTHTLAERWNVMSDATSVSDSNPSSPAFYKKHLMFIDENVITLDSPELQYEAVSFDNADYNFRIVGIAKMTSVISDYTVDAARSSVPGESLDRQSFSGTIESRNGNISGLIAWPLWKEYGLQISPTAALGNKPLAERTPDDYIGDSGKVVRYWLYMWQHSGVISGYSKVSEDDNISYSVLDRKVFANLRYSYNTVYLNTPAELAVSGLRCVNELSHSYHNLRIGTQNSYTEKYYTGDVNLMLSMPGSVRYPLLFSDGSPDSTVMDMTADSESANFASSAPVLLEFRTNSHAVLSLATSDTDTGYVQTILPRFIGEEPLSIPVTDTTNHITGALLPWIDFDLDSGSYPFKNYGVVQQQLTFTANHALADTLNVDNDQYLFIGEIYKDYGEGAADTRYGGISLSAVKNNRFIAAGPQYNIASLTNDYIFGNQGDTFFQRWDCLRTKPYSSDTPNGVIDITSVMLETHINLDGRSDLQRGITELASINTAQFGMLNKVYSQMNNFSVSHDLDDEFNTDSYRSALTWTMQKKDMADIDEWTHITLASTLKLDADKGICRAIRRFQNTLVAFQDRAISEILFNSRTQLSTQDGVPVEIGNSGKVDGKRYITNKYGCLNKWSIVEGKAALYFVDNINKAFCAFNGNIDNLSSKLGFSVWFKNSNSTEPWRPDLFNNVVSFYDRLHSDVYLVRANVDNPELPALVYNETLGRFTSFFNYSDVPMMANVEDRFISFYGNTLWLQNEGVYGEFFGEQYPFSVQYRVTPDSYGDKIWTNVEYRADFYRVLDSDIDKYPVESDFTDDVGIYQPDETFDHMRFWNEYQTTPTDESYLPKIEKKFRVWRVIIPRAVKTTKNKFGLDRIRNPWLNLLFSKKAVAAGEKQDLMQLHDITVKYFE